MSTTRRSGWFRCSASQSVVTRGSWSVGISSTPSMLVGRETRSGFSRVLPPAPEQAMFEGVGLGEGAGAFLVLLAEAAFDDLVLEVVFEDPDPGPRVPAELAHELVAVERALEPLDRVLGANLLHALPEAAPGLLGDAPAPRGAPRDIGPGEP